MVLIKRGDHNPRVSRSTVTVYWRPGCPYCARLTWGLRRLKVASTRLNIWTDADAAAFVRSVNGGNETVPTVLIGDTTLVNPSAREVRRELDKYLPHHDDTQRRLVVVRWC